MSMKKGSPITRESIHPRYPLTGKCTNIIHTCAYTYTKQTEEIYSAIRKNEITAFSEEMDGAGGCIVGKNKLDTRKSVCFCYAD